MQKRAETEMQNRYCVQTDCEKSELYAAMQKSKYKNSREK